ncbi:hypothetical protein [Sphingomonas paeninsulae]|uniref:hypothetical protein n=1 Tax=Sphingomonas paeninsulae TaxID=2319844 RepID=UPI00196948B7|nr:hypothetical protein [Sphingomonas paeninsulae]
MASSKPAAAPAGSPLIRCLAIYRQMPVHFTLTALMLLLVNIALVVQQGLVGRAVHEASVGGLSSKTLRAISITAAPGSG